MRVSSIGEILVDIIPKRSGEYTENMEFEAHLGGAPFNYAVAMARLGAIPYGMGAVGSDFFGKMLVGVLKDNNVRTECLKVKNARTSLAFIILNEDGERTFFFYRAPWVNTADSMYSVEDLREDVIMSSEVLYVSGMALSAGPLRDAVLEAMRIGREADVTVIFDYNVRPDVWFSLEEMKKLYDYAIGDASVISLSIDEVETLYGISDPIKAMKYLLRMYAGKDILLKLGKEGCIVHSDERTLLVRAYKVKAIDTTGAGDAWIAAFSYYHYLLEEDLEESSIMANALGAITVTKRGAISAFSSRKDLEEFVSNNETPEIIYINI